MGSPALLRQLGWLFGADSTASIEMFLELQQPNTPLERRDGIVRNFIGSGIVRLLEMASEAAPAEDEMRAMIEGAVEKGMPYTERQLEFAARYSVKKEVLDTLLGGVVIGD